MKPLHKKIWQACNHATTATNKNSSLRDIFDPFEADYNDTTREEKLELLLSIKKECNCSFDDIFQAFYTYYASMQNYEHVLKDSLKGLARLTPFSLKKSSDRAALFSSLDTAIKNASSDKESEEPHEHLIDAFRKTFLIVKASGPVLQESFIQYFSESVYAVIYSGFLFNHDRGLFLDYTALFTEYLDNNLSRFLSSIPDPRKKNKATAKKKVAAKKPAAKSGSKPKNTPARAAKKASAKAAKKSTVKKKTVKKAEAKKTVNSNPGIKKTSRTKATAKKKHNKEKHLMEKIQ